MSQSASRTTLYIGAVSSALVALGFIGQVSEVGDAFDVFALTVLPTLYVLGALTFIRVVECGAEDFRYGLAINRIRGYYRQLAGDQANLSCSPATTTAAAYSRTWRCRSKDAPSCLASRPSWRSSTASSAGARSRSRRRARRAAGRRGGDRRRGRDRVGAGLGAAGGAPADPAHRRDRADVPVALKRAATVRRTGQLCVRCAGALARPAAGRC